MICFGCRNVRRHRDIENGEKYTTWDILLKFGSIENMRIISSDAKDYLVISGKGLITSLGLKTNVRPEQKKGKVCHDQCQYEGYFKYAL